MSWVDRGEAPTDNTGCLSVVGVGIGFAMHVPPNIVSIIEKADAVLYLAADPATAAWLHKLNETARSLSRPRPAQDTLAEEVYESMAQQVIETLAAAKRVALVTYGHPAVYHHTAHRAIELARAAGYDATMFPAVSAFDCMLADLGIDPALGCVMYDATALVLSKLPLDPRLHLVLWQIGVFANPYYKKTRRVPLDLLVERIANAYGSRHRACIYSAPLLPTCAPRIEVVPIDELASVALDERCLLYIPASAPQRADIATAARLGRALAGPITPTEGDER